MNWNSLTTDTIIYHETFLETPSAFSENPDIVEDSKVYHAMLLVRFLVSAPNNSLQRPHRGPT